VGKGEIEKIVFRIERFECIENNYLGIGFSPFGFGHYQHPKRVY
jgi:hypothetical protein